MLSEILNHRKLEGIEDKNDWMVEINGKMRVRNLKWNGRMKLLIGSLSKHYRNQIH